MPDDDPFKGDPKSWPRVAEGMALPLGVWRDVLAGTRDLPPDPPGWEPIPLRVGSSRESSRPDRGE